MKARKGFSQPRFTRRFVCGQAMTEYVLIVANCLLVAVGAMTLFLGYFGDFYSNLLSVVDLPIP